MKPLFLLAILLGTLPRLPAAPAPAGLTNVARLSAMSRLDLNRGRPFSLKGFVTMVDPERNLFVLQDATGALAVYADKPVDVHAGTQVELQADKGVPFSVNFPDYPFHRAGVDVRTNLEAPSDWGDFHLTRMSGYLHPPVTGDYTFWIASDNSSELWLSTDESPSNVQHIASVRSGLWVNPHEWFRYPFQRSAPVLLETNRAYYLEAFTEQQEQAEHMAVAWQGPGLAQSVISGNYLTPWNDGSLAATNGILREYWTNFAPGTLTPITGERHVESAVSAHGVHVSVLSSNVWPEPMAVALGRQLSSEQLYRWVETDGALDFRANEGGRVTLELRAGSASALVRVAHWHGAPLPGGTNLHLKVRGVCEPAAAGGGVTVPGILWAESNDQIQVVEMPATNTESAAFYAAPPTNATTSLGGFFLARGVVTFNGRALTNNYLVVQDANSGVFITTPEHGWPGAHLHVGDNVEIGGNLLRGKYAPRLRPSLVNVLGKHLLPQPAVPAPEAGVTAFRDGQWTELEGVGRQLLTNGMLLLHRRADRLLVAVADASRAQLNQCVDATVRLRGVISLDTPDDRPLLLVPSPTFIQVLAGPPPTLPLQSIASIAEAVQARFSHRLRVAGTVTYRDPDLMVIQDSSAAVQVHAVGALMAQVGDAVEVTGFPEQYNSMLLLDQAVVRPAGPREKIRPSELDAGEGLGALTNQMLVRLKANLLSQKQVGPSRVLEVQIGHRVLQAVLVGKADTLNPLAPGSLLRLTGVCMMEAANPPASGGAVWESASIGTVHLLLRDPGDVVLLRGPPWWSWKKAAVLIGVLLALLAGTVLRVQILRRRFEKQQAARLAFARQLLEHQESERRRIAANLHDTLGQNLLAIKNQAHLALQSAGDASLAHRLEEISGTVLDALEEVRQITHDLRPYQLDRLGLSQALRALVRKAAEGRPIEMASHVDELDGIFPKEAEMHIYRIVQEGLNNVIKHSRATEAAVVLKVESSLLSISIRDNGRGLAPNGDGATDHASGFGLDGIRERALILKGRTEVDAPTGQGFSLKIEIPLPATPVTPARDHGIPTEVAHR